MRFLPYALLLATLQCHATDSALNTFESVVAGCRPAYSAPLPKVFFQPSIKKWVKRIDYPGNFKYDVRKTDSLVSPITAYIEASTLGATVFVDTEEQASGATPGLGGKVSRSTTRYNYAYRNNTWVFVNAAEIMEWRDSENQSFREPMSFPRTKASLIKDALPWSVCIVE